MAEEEEISAEVTEEPVLVLSFFSPSSNLWFIINLHLNAFLFV
jgi:hypothetical protein